MIDLPHLLYCVVKVVFTGRATGVSEREVQ